MIGVPGTAQRLFGALRDAGVSVMLISQGSSEHSICFAVPAAQAVRAEEVVRARLRRRAARGPGAARRRSTRDCSILAVVGDDMAGSHGVAAKVFSALGNAGINVRAIAQGASERNISVVIDVKDMTRAMRAVHASFYLSPHTVSIGVLGPGLVGKALLEQLASQCRAIAPRLQARPARACDRRHRSQMLLDESAHRAGRVARAIAKRRPNRWTSTRFAQHVQADHLPHAVIIDCTRQRSGRGALRATGSPRGIHVVTPNKNAHSGRVRLLRGAQGGAPRRARALPLRGHGWRWAARDLRR